MALPPPHMFCGQNSTSSTLDHTELPYFQYYRFRIMGPKKAEPEKEPEKKLTKVSNIQFFRPMSSCKGTVIYSPTL